MQVGTLLSRSRLIDVEVRYDHGDVLLPAFDSLSPVKTAIMGSRQCDIGMDVHRTVLICFSRLPALRFVVRTLDPFSFRTAALKKYLDSSYLRPSLIHDPYTFLSLQVSTSHYLDHWHSEDNRPYSYPRLVHLEHC
jgi:hypothetical protein